MEQVELPYAVGRYNTARYSLVLAKPQTGRQHQIRRHLSHLRHPVIGDKKHGDIKHNKFFSSEWNLNNMFLHAKYLAFEHPLTKQRTEIKAPLPTSFQQALALLSFKEPINLTLQSFDEHTE